MDPSLRNTFSRPFEYHVRARNNANGSEHAFNGTWRESLSFILFSATQSTVMKTPRRQQMAWPLWPIWGVWRVEMGWFLAGLNHNAQVSGTFPPRYALTKIINIGKNTPFRTYKGSMTRAPCFESVTWIIANAAVGVPQATVSYFKQIYNLLLTWSLTFQIDRMRAVKTMYGKVHAPKNGALQNMNGSECTYITI